RLDPPVEALREAGQLLDPGHRYPERRDPLGRAAGGHDRHTRLTQRLRQRFQARLVIDADQCATDRAAVVGGHGIVTFLPVMVQPSRTSRPTWETSWCRSASLMRPVSVSSVSSSSTGTVACATIGPVSLPASTTHSVAPVTLTPSARAYGG